MHFKKSIYGYKKFEDSYFILNEIGFWDILSRNEFVSLQNFPKEDLPKNLINKFLKKYIIYKDNTLKEAQDICLNKFSDILHGPAFFVIGLTKHCNFNCSYCYATARNYKEKKVKNLSLSSETINKIVDFILNIKNEDIGIEFQGGEPFLVFDTIKNFVQQSKKINLKYNKKISFSITTNVSLLNDEILRFLKKEKFAISVSLDGNKKIHDQQRKYFNGKGSYDNVIKNIAKLKENNLEFGLLSVITNKTKNHYKEIIIAHINQNIKIINFNKVQYYGNARQKNLVYINNEQFLVFWKKSIEYIFTLNKQGIIVTENFLVLILQKLFGKKDPNYLDWRNLCGAIISELSFDMDGNIYPCDEARATGSLRLGNVHKDTYLTILNKPLAKAIIKSSILEGHICNYCVYKPICGICPLIEFQESQDLSIRLYKEKNKCTLYSGMLDFIIQKIIYEKEKILGALFVMETLNLKEIK